MKLIEKYKNLGKLQKLALWSITLFVAYTAFGFLILPPLTRIIAEKQLTKMVGRTLTIEKIKMNPFALTVDISGLKFARKESADPLLAFDALHANLQGVSLFKLAPVVREVRLDGPYFYIAHQKAYDLKAGFNFSDMLILQPFLTRQPDETAAPEKEDSEPFRFSIANIQITNGKIEVDDLPVKKHHTVDAINIGIPFVSNLDQDVEVFVQPRFAATINGAPFELGGKTKPFSDSLQTEIKLDLEDIDLPYYFAYSPVRNIAKLLSGTLDINLTLAFVQNNDGTQQAFLTGGVGIQNLRVNDLQDNRLASISSIEMRLARSELLSGNVHFDTIAIESPEFMITRNREKEINVYNLIQADTPQKGEPGKKDSEATGGQLFTLLLDTLSVNNARLSMTDQGPSASGAPTATRDLFSVSAYQVKDISVSMASNRVTVAEISLDGGAMSIHRQSDGLFNFQALIPPSAAAASESPETENEPPAPAPSGNAWIVDLNRIAVDNFRIEALQVAPDQTGDFIIDDIHLAATKVTNEKGVPATIDLAMKINETAAFQTSGKVVMLPFSATMNADLKDLRLAWFQPFLKDFVTVAVPDGAVSTGGDITASLDPEKGITVALKNGGVRIADLKVLESGSKKLLTWKNLNVSGIEAGYEPTFAKINAVTLDGLYSRVYLDKKGQPNVLSILKKQPNESQSPETPSTGGSAELPPVSIGKVSVRSGKIAFTDNSANPVFSTHIDKVGLEAKKLSTDKNSRASFSFSGRMAGHAPLKIEGDVNPLSEDLYLDLALIFDNMDLTAFSPYSGRWAGYTIHKGKLSLDLDYKLEKNALEAGNKIMIDQFEFGDEVESDDAVNLPVKLGVSLLKDRNGRIGLNVPLGGSLDDPEFSVGAIILDVIGNLLVKAATAPFALIASMFDSEEDLQHIEFEPGSAVLTDTAGGKLDTLSTALYERPQLKLEVAGYCAEDDDTAVLSEIAFQNMLKKFKIQENYDEDDPQPTLEEITILPEEYGELVLDLHEEMEDNELLAPMTDEEEDAMDAEMDAAEEISDEAEDAVEVKHHERRIRETIQVTQGDLRLLARSRAEAVVQYLLASEKVDADRLFLTDPGELAPEPLEEVKNSRVSLDLR